MPSDRHAARNSPAVLGAVVGVKDDPGRQVPPSAAGRDGGQQRVQAQLRAQVVGDGPAEQSS
jgi:hypothetical protein